VLIVPALIILSLPTISSKYLIAATCPSLQRLKSKSGAFLQSAPDTSFFLQPANTSKGMSYSKGLISVIPSRYAINDEPALPRELI
jgi:hypothetical protein